MKLKSQHNVILILSVMFFFLSAQMVTAECGDINADSKINIVDALLIAQDYVGEQKLPVTSADTNGDKTVNIIDALLIAQYYVGIIKEFPGCSSSGSGTEPGTAPEGLIGWASVTGKGWNGITLQTTTGGGNAAPVKATTMKQLNELARGDKPAVIHVSGELKGAFVPGSNKTIIGLSGARINGNIQIGPLTDSEAAKSDLMDDQEGGVHNIIIKNLSIKGGEDTININYSHHIWLDHLEITDGSDGILDIVRASDYITVSWCKIYYNRGGGHRLASLIGNRNDLGKIDTGRLQITLHHNWWGKGISGRQPRVRFGKLHLFNNLHTNSAGYAVACGVHANILSESNIYDGTDAFDYGDTSSDAALKSVNDVLIKAGSKKEKNPGSVFTPPYAYKPDSTDKLRALIEANAGPKQ